MIRDLIADDVNEIIELGALMHQESPLGGFTFNRERATYILSDILGDTAVFAMGYFHEGKLAGMLIGEVSTHLFVDVQIAADIVFYVAPGRRGAVASKRLIDQFKAWSAEIRADITRVQVDAGIDNDRACAFLGHLGFEPKGTSMMIGI